MKLILKRDLKGLGKKNDTVDVKPGYARNYLIPNNIGVTACQDNIKIALENIRQSAHKTVLAKQHAEDLAKRLVDLALEVRVRSSTSGKVFGSVSSAKLSTLLKEQGFSVDRKNIKLKTQIKTLGNYEATLILHPEVTYCLQFRVVGMG